MSEGHDWTTPPFAKKVYYWPFGKTFWGFAGISFAFFVLAISLMYVLNVRNWHLIDLLLITAASLVASAIQTIICYRFGTVVLTPETICTFNPYNVRQTMRLDGIEKVCKAWYGLGLFLIVKEKGVFMRLWIPLFLLDERDFINSLAQVVPQDNPLRKYYEGQS